MAAGLLWILDASINISMEPFRAFVADLLPPGSARDGFAMQSFFIGLGAVVASALPWDDDQLVWRRRRLHPRARAIPTTVRLSFYHRLGRHFWAPCCTPSSRRAKSRPLTSRRSRSRRAQSAGIGGTAKAVLKAGFASARTRCAKLALVQISTWLGLFCMWLYFAPGVAKGIFRGAPLGVASAAVDRTLDEPQNAPVLDGAATVARAYEAN